MGNVTAGIQGLMGEDPSFFAGNRRVTVRCECRQNRFTSADAMVCPAGGGVIATGTFHFE